MKSSFKVGKHVGKLCRSHPLSLLHVVPIDVVGGEDRSSLTGRQIILLLKLPLVLLLAVRVFAALLQGVNELVS